MYLTTVASQLKRKHQRETCTGHITCLLAGALVQSVLGVLLCFESTSLLCMGEEEEEEEGVKGPATGGGGGWVRAFPAPAADGELEAKQSLFIHLTLFH